MTTRASGFADFLLTDDSGVPALVEHPAGIEPATCRLQGDFGHGDQDSRPW
jgi:hypothetical protein